MSITRRDFLKSGATAAAIAAMSSVPRPLLAQLDGRHPELIPPADDPRLKALASRAIDAARSAGCTYADVRLSHTWNERLPARGPFAYELLAVGVRALVDGYWGFASGPVWSPDEMARLGREAVHQAKTNSLGKPRIVDFAPVAVVPDGHWVMPAIDGIELSPLEVSDYLTGLEIFARRQPGGRVNITNNSCQFVRQDKVFASTAGSYYTQRCFRTDGSFQFKLEMNDGKKGEGALDLLTPAGLGWELYRDQPLRDAIRAAVEEVREDLMLPIKPVDVGRYDTVLDAASMASMLHETIGPATELDRALGYEANAGGTSYLTDPLGMVGHFQVGAPLLQVTGNRSEPGGSATVMWDDEGVAPGEFALVKDGMLTDFQTTRESAGWLKDYYGKAGRPFRSHGCASAPSGINAPLQRAPNLVMTPANGAENFDSLVAGLTRGIAIKGISVDMDFQHSSGFGLGRIYEVKNGKRVAIINAAAVLFRSSELWKGLLTVGGKSSMRRFGMASQKGEPTQEHYSSVTAPPAVFKQVTLVDALRRA